MAAELVLLAVAVPVAGLAGWASRSLLARRSEARANACLEGLFAQRVARFPTGYARTGRGR